MPTPPRSADRLTLLASRLREGRSAAPATEIVPLGRSDYPLSFGQARLWFLQQLDPASTAYHTQLVLRLRGRLDPPDLRQTLERLVARHAILRTRIVAAEGEARQRIEPSVVLPYDEIDLSDLPAEARANRLASDARDELDRAFDTATAPLMRARLVKTAADEHHLLLTFHHLIADGWSFGIFKRELEAVYGALRRGQALDLPALPIQYGDYAAWQRALADEPDMRRHLAYWQTALSGVDAPPALPGDGSREGSGVASELAFTLDPALTGAVKTFARAARTTPFVVWLAALKLLLARYTGATDIVVGTPFAGRDRRELASLIGFCASTLPLRTAVDGRGSFRDLVGAVSDTARQAFAHHEAPFERIVQLVAPDRVAGRQPLFDVMLAYQTGDGRTKPSPMRLADVEARTVRLAPRTPRYALDLDIVERTRSTQLLVTFDAGRFQPERIRRLIANWESTLRAGLAQPEADLRRMPSISVEQEHEAIYGWNDTRREYVSTAHVHEMFAHCARMHPARAAIRERGVDLSYAALQARVHRVAWRLHRLGAGPDRTVAVVADPSADLIAALFGVLTAGAAYVPIAPDTPMARALRIIEDCDATAVLTGADYAARFADVARPVLPIAELLEDDDPSALVSTPYHPRRVADANLAYVIYTSGSTGTPKGVMNTHGAVRGHLLWMQERLALSPDDRVLLKTPFTFDVSVWELFWPLTVGATVVVPPPDVPRDRRALADALRQEAITSLHLVPSMLDVLLAGPGLADCPALTRVLCVGEALSPALQRQFFAHAPADLHNLYGPTETAVAVSHWPCDPAAPSGDAVPIGRPMANAQLFVLDACGRAVAAGVEGELHIGGAPLARGYLGRPDLTAAQFVPDPFASTPGQRLYRTGDLACHRLDGAIEFRGRLDQQIKLRGFRVELGEIESALLAQPGIQQACAIARADPPGDTRLVAYVVVTPDAALDRRPIVQALSGLLPDYMVPAAYVEVAALPLNASGKLDRRALPAPSRADHVVAAADTEPLSPAETVMAAIWAEALGVDTVGRDDNFFRLGGHSLLAIEMTSRIEHLLDVAVPLRLAFDHPTVGAYVAALARDPARQSALDRAAALAVDA